MAVERHPRRPGQPSRSDLASFLGVPTETVDEAQPAEGLYQGWSLDVPIGHASTLLGETLPDAQDTFAPIEAALMAGPAIARLSPRERTILRMCLVDNLTQAQMGRAIDVGQMQVSRLLADIVAKLHKGLSYSLEGWSA